MVRNASRDMPLARSVVSGCTREADGANWKSTMPYEIMINRQLLNHHHKYNRGTPEKCCGFRKEGSGMYSAAIPPIPGLSKRKGSRHWLMEWRETSVTEIEQALT